MSKEAKGARGQTKRPYERPRLEPSEIFGAEAMTGSCCRRTYGACSTTARNTKRTTTDSNKAQTSTSS